MKTGVAITTYNSEDYFSKLFESLPRDKIDELVVINGGDEYKNNYKEAHWLQHHTNCNPSRCRNDGLNFLAERDVDFYFIIEDDMIIKDSSILERYIQALEDSRLGYLCFTSTSWGSGEPGARTPEMEMQVSKDTTICLYPNMCNEFTVRTRSCLKDSGNFNVDFTSMWDVENVYRISNTSHMYGFWRFPDIKNSDDYIMNNPDATSRINDGGKRDKIMEQEYEKFKQTTGVYVQQIPKQTSVEIITSAETLMGNQI